MSRWPKSIFSTR